MSFNPTDVWYLASASFDKSISLVDCRSGASNALATIGCDPESLAWNPNNSNHLYCSLEDGLVVCVDIRYPGRAPLFSFKAHEETTSSISFSGTVPGLMATSSIDKTVKVWDVTPGSTAPPKLVGYKSMNVGKIFAMQFSSDVPYLLTCGGDGGLVAVWESDELEAIHKHFSPRVERQLAASTIEGAAALPESLGGLALGASEVMDTTEEEGADFTVLEEDGGESTPAVGKKDKKKKKNKKDKK